MLSRITSHQRSAVSRQQAARLFWFLFVQRLTLIPQRSGATLVEILMSILIMSVGMTAVIGLFPLSLLTSVRATQLTNARLLEENVVELLRTNPELVEGGYPTWQPNTAYAVGDIVTLPRANGQVLSKTGMIFQAVGAGTSGALPPSFVSAWGHPTLDPPVTPTITWQAIRYDDLQNPAAVVVSSPAAWADSVYVVDPLGSWNQLGATVAPDYTAASLLTRFGADDTGLLSAAANYAVPIRHNSGLTFAQARELFTLQDSWSADLEAVPSDIQLIPPGTPTQTQITFPPNADLTAFAAGGRLVLTPTNGGGTFIYELQGTDDIGVTTKNVLTINSATVLPAGFDTLAEVGQCRLETFTGRYTYLLTVRRRANGDTKISCPVFFNRSFTGGEERVVPVQTAAGSSTIQVQWAAGGATPLIKENGYLFDPINGDWYRIVEPPSGTLVAGVTYTVVVDRPFNTTSVTDFTTTFDGGVIFMPGVIHVFDIEL